MDERGERCEVFNFHFCKRIWKKNGKIIWEAIEFHHRLPNRYEIFRNRITTHNKYLSASVPVVMHRSMGCLLIIIYAQDKCLAKVNLTCSNVRVLPHIYLPCWLRWPLKSSMSYIVLCRFASRTFNSLPVKLKWSHLATFHRRIRVDSHYERAHKFFHYFFTFIRELRSYQSWQRKKKEIWFYWCVCVHEILDATTSNSFMSFFLQFSIFGYGSWVALHYYNRGGAIGGAWKNESVENRHLWFLCSLTLGRHTNFVFLYSLHLHTLISDFDWILRRSVRILIKSFTFECENGENIPHNTIRYGWAQKRKNEI